MTIKGSNYFNTLALNEEWKKNVYQENLFLFLFRGRKELAGVLWFCLEKNLLIRP